MEKPWIALDLDGTVAHYDKWQGPVHIGPPVGPMVERVRKWLDAGRDVRIFTARVSSDGTPERDVDAVAARNAIERWCQQHLGQVLVVTNVKDYDMVELWDDRAVAVEHNTGRPLNQSTRGL